MCTAGIDETGVESASLTDEQLGELIRYALTGYALRRWRASTVDKAMKALKRASHSVGGFPILALWDGLQELRYRLRGFEEAEKEQTASDG